MNPPLQTSTNPTATASTTTRRRAPRRPVLAPSSSASTEPAPQVAPEADRLRAVARGALLGMGTALDAAGEVAPLVSLAKYAVNAARVLDNIKFFAERDAEFMAKLSSADRYWRSPESDEAMEALGEVLTMIQTHLHVAKEGLQDTFDATRSGLQER